MNDLTILCVTAGEPHAARFLDAMHVAAMRLDCEFVCCIDGRDVHSNGCIESVLDDAVARCPDGWILRLDDDERMSDGMVDWLAAGHYREHDHWAFRRANLWPDENSYILNPPLWPDLQTRLSVKAKSGGRTRVHAGSPFGTGTVAPCVLEHHKFLVRPREEREALVERYERIEPGAGLGYSMFSVPEPYEDQLRTAPLGNVLVPC